MKTLRRLAWLLLGLLACTAFGESNTIRIISAVASNESGTCFVGVSGTNNLLLVTNAGVFNAASGAFVGYLPAALDNRAAVCGNGSLWTVDGMLVLGFQGSFNRLTVSAGGRLINSNVALVGSEAVAGHNEVLLTGAGSSWLNTNQALYVGYHGDANRVTVSNAALLRAQNVILGDSSQAESNTLRITAFNSSVVCLSNLVCGVQGADSLVEMKSGAYLQDEQGVIGAGAAARGNRVMVDGAVWSNGLSVSVGRQGSFNSLLITNGGFVICQGGGFIGEQSNAVGNTALVDEGLMVFSKEVCVGAQGSSNRLVVRNGGILGCSSDLYVGDTPAGATGACGNVVLAAGTSTQWRMQGSLYMARRSTGNRVELRAGAFLECTNAVLGDREGFVSSNQLVVADAGTIWSNKGEVWVHGLGDAVGVSNGARASVWATRLDGSLSSSPPRLLVTDPGSEWDCHMSLGVGIYDQAGEVLIANGGLVKSGSGVIGFNAGGQQSLVAVVGAGSVWTNTGALMLGVNGFDNQLQVKAGGTVYSDRAVIGQATGANHNRALIEGAGSWWACGALTVGVGMGNELSIENGGRMACTSAVLGVGSGLLATGNFLRVSGAGSVLTNESFLWVGESSADNSLWIEEGARVDTALLCVGVTNSASNNVVYVQTNSLLVVGGLAEIRRGALKLNEGVVACSNLVVQTNGVLVGEGALQVVRVRNYGVTRVGQPAGLLTANGYFSQEAGSTLAFDLAGLEPGIGYGQLDSQKGFGLGGTLQVSRTTGFLPKLNDEFLLVSWTGGHSSTTFAWTNLPAWFDWQLLNSNPKTGLVLRVTGVHAALNGVPKAWLVDHGWTNDFDNAALGDPDADRVPTWQEYFAGTDPNDAGSVFQCLDIAQELSPIPGTVLRWQAATGCVYAVDVSTNLLTPAWAVLTNQLSAPVHSWTDTVTQAGSGQYRLRVKIE